MQVGLFNLIFLSKAEEALKKQCSFVKVDILLKNLLYYH